MAKAKIKAVIIGDRKVEFDGVNVPGYHQYLKETAREFLKRTLTPAEYNRTTDIEIDIYRQKKTRHIGGPSHGQKNNFK